MSDLAGLVADLARAAAAIEAAAQPALRSAAKAIRKDWRSVPPWSGSKHLPSLGSHLDYDVDGLDAEIGVNKGGQGNLGHLIEFGSINNAPHPGGPPALAKNAPLFAAELALIAERLVAGGGASVRSTSMGPSRFNTRRGGEAWPGFED